MRKVNQLRGVLIKQLTISVKIESCEKNVTTSKVTGKKGERTDVKITGAEGGCERV